MKALLFMLFNKINFFVFLIPILIILLAVLYDKIKKLKENNVNYKTTAIWTFCYALYLLISALVSFFEETTKESLENVIVFGVTTVISIYIYLKLKDLTNKFFKTKAVDNIIYMLIITEIILYLVNILTYVYEFDFTKYDNLSMGILFIGIVMLYGIVGIIYGKAIKKISNESDFKIYGNLIIISSILNLTILGFLLGMLIQAIAYFYLAIIFNKCRIENLDEKVRENLVKENYFIKEKLNDYEKIKEEENKIKIPRSKMEAEIYFNNLSFNDYQNIKLEATKYLSEGLSEEELKNVIIDHIIRKYI